MRTKVLTAQVALSRAKKIDELAARLADRHQMTLEALADVDKGNVIDHQAVQSWADSLESEKPIPQPRR